MNHFFLPGSLPWQKAAIRTLVLTALMFAINLTAQAQVVFDNVRDIGPPPSALGIYNMIQVVDNTKCEWVSNHVSSAAEWGSHHTGQYNGKG